MQTKGKIPIEGLLDGYEAVLTEMGYSITTKLLLVRRADLMIRRHQNAGLVYFDQAIINRYTGEIDDKYFKGNMQKKHYERIKREMRIWLESIRGRFEYMTSGTASRLPV